VVKWEQPRVQMSWTANDSTPQTMMYLICRCSPRQHDFTWATPFFRIPLAGFFVFFLLGCGVQKFPYGLGRPGTRKTEKKSSFSQMASGGVIRWSLLDFSVILDLQGLPFVCCFLSSFFSFLRLTVSFSQKRGFPLKTGGSPGILAVKTW
jgi:hypothetical protein